MNKRQERDRPVVVVGYPIDERVRREVLEPDFDVRMLSEGDPLEPALSDADGLVTLLTRRIDASVLDAAPRLRVVGNVAVGVDNIDLEACKARGVRVVNTPDVLTRATAELALTLLLAAARRVPEGERMCREGRFAGWRIDMLLGLELQGRKALIVGKGRIGAELGRLLSALGLEVGYVTRDTPKETADQLLSEAQVISLHLPLRDDTRHWLNRERILWLREDAIVINTARGPLIDEEALIDALEERRIFAAGLDVYEREPHIPERLRRLDNVVLLPHLGSATRKTRYEMARLAAEGVAAVLRGERPANLVV